MGIAILCRLSCLLFLVLALSTSFAEETIDNEALLEAIRGSSSSSQGSVRGSSGRREASGGQKEKAVEEAGVTYLDKLISVETGVSKKQPISIGDDIYTFYAEKKRRPEAAGIDATLIFIDRAEYIFRGTKFNTVNVEYRRRHICRKDGIDQVRSREKEMMKLKLNDKGEARFRTFPYEDEELYDIPRREIVITIDENPECINAKEL